jgi:hypothetical protein
MTSLEWRHHIGAEPAWAMKHGALIVEWYIDGRMMLYGIRDEQAARDIATKMFFMEEETRKVTVQGTEHVDEGLRDCEVEMSVDSDKNVTAEIKNEGPTYGIPQADDLSYLPPLSPPGDPAQ